MNWSCRGSLGLRNDEASRVGDFVFSYGARSTADESLSSASPSVRVLRVASVLHAGLGDNDSERRDVKRRRYDTRREAPKRSWDSAPVSGGNGGGGGGGKIFFFWSKCVRRAEIFPEWWPHIAFVVSLTQTHKCERKFQTAPTMSGRRARGLWPAGVASRLRSELPFRTGRVRTPRTLRVVLP